MRQNIAQRSIFALYDLRYAFFLCFFPEKTGPSSSSFTSPLVQLHITQPASVFLHCVPKSSPFYFSNNSVKN